MVVQLRRRPRHEVEADPGSTQTFTASSRRRRTRSSNRSIQRPSAQRPDRRPSFRCHQHRFAPDGRIHTPAVRFRLLTQNADSKVDAAASPPVPTVYTKSVGRPRSAFCCRWAFGNRPKIWVNGHYSSIFALERCCWPANDGTLEDGWRAKRSGSIAFPRFSGAIALEDLWQSRVWMSSTAASRLNSS